MTETAETLKEDDTSSKPIEVASLWREIAAMFKARSAVSPSVKSWFSGLPSRIGYSRIDRLRESKRAKALNARLSKLPSETIKAVRTYAAINQEQAVSAFRVTIVTNITLPVGILALLHQLLPQGLGQGILDLYGNEEGALIFLFAITGVTLFFLSWIMVYAWASVSQARDIRHLVDLHAAERGIYFGLEDMDDASLN
jgi:hypothetical protein